MTEEKAQHILLVDSSRLYLGILQKGLARTRVNCHYAANGKEALEATRQQAFDIVVTVAQLSDMTGPQLARLLRETAQCAFTPIILLTGSAAQMSQELRNEEGITEIFRKQDIEELVNFTQRFLASNNPLSGKLLYVEDSADQRMLLAAQLRQWGLTVDEFSSADEAWASFICKNYDLVVTDIVLDGQMSGSRLVNRIRRLSTIRGDTPILAITAFDSAARRVELFHLGVNDYVPKPVLAEELRARIRGLISHKQSVERDRQLLNATNMAVLTIDEVGTIQFCNADAERIFGYREADLVGQNIKRLMPEPYSSEHDSYLARYLETGEPRILNNWYRELVGRRSDGSVFPMHLSVSQMTQSGRRIFAGMIRDITIEKRAEQELRRATEVAEQASRSKSEFLASMSHEIRTPMNGVIGMTEMMLKTKLSDEQRRMMNIVRDSAQAQLGILDDILDFSKIEAGRMDLSIEPFSPAELVTRICSSLDGHARQKGVTVRHVLDRNLPRALEGDGLRVRQIIANFLTNAIKFSSGLQRQGEVELHACLAGSAQGKLWIELSVHDNGIGMDGATLARVFQPFAQADSSTTRKYGGTGLGLVISRRLAEAMGGEVSVESEPGVGSTFTVKLPFAPTDENRLVAATDASQVEGFVRPPPSREDALRQQQLILVAEDNETNQEVIRQQLNLLGYQCDLARDGREAFGKWLTGDYALLLSDIHMPILDGYQLTGAIRLEEAKRGTGRTPILALTANVLTGEADHCRAAGMDGYLAKPVSLSDLMGQLARWLPAAAADPEGDKHKPQVADKPAGALPSFDPEVLRRVLGNQPETYRRVLELFLRNSREQAQGLRERGEAGDAAAAGRIAHSLKSSARAVGALRLGDVCDRLELACRTGELAPLRTELDVFAAAFDSACGAIRANLDSA